MSYFSANQLKEGRVYFCSWLRLQSVMAGQVWQREQETAGPIAVEVRKQRDGCGGGGLSSLFLCFVSRTATHGRCLPHVGVVGLGGPPTSADLI